MTTAPTLTAFASGQTSGVALQLNKLQAALASVAGFGGNGYGVVDGLGLSVSAGLTLAIATGRAEILGTVEYAGGTKALPDNTARVCLWLKVDGTIEARTDLTPPATAAVFIGSCVTSGGTISAIDTSGVVYLRGGLGVRDTADEGKPGDSPSSHTIFVTRTRCGDWLWDSAKYVWLATPLQLGKTTLESGDACVVPSGHSLTLFDGLTIPAGASVVVKSGGKLEIRG